jgi:hypothetical protein
VQGPPSKDKLRIQPPSHCLELASRAYIHNLTLPPAASVHQVQESSLLAVHLVPVLCPFHLLSCPSRFLSASGPSHLPWPPPPVRTCCRKPTSFGGPQPSPVSNNRTQTVNLVHHRCRFASDHTSPSLCIHYSYNCRHSSRNRTRRTFPVDRPDRPPPGLQGLPTESVYAQEKANQFPNGAGPISSIGSVALVSSLPA